MKRKINESLLLAADTFSVDPRSWKCLGDSIKRLRQSWIIECGSKVISFWHGHDTIHYGNEADLMGLHVCPDLRQIQNSSHGIPWINLIVKNDLRNSKFQKIGLHLVSHNPNHTGGVLRDC